MAKTSLTNLQCFDTGTNVWYPLHEWYRGCCSHCGKKQPAVSDEAREEMAAEHEARRLAAAGKVEG